MLEDMHAKNLDISAISLPRGTGGVMGLQCGLPWKTPAWDDLRALSFEDRLKAISNEETVSRLVAEAKAEGSDHATEMFWLGDGEKPNYAAGSEASLATLAEQNLEHPAETFLRMARESKGRALYTYRFFNKNLKAVAHLLSCDHCLPGLGDAGAHVSQVTDGGWATFWLSHWIRDVGLHPLEDAVRRVTAAPARVMGLRDRGILAAGMKADINVIDLDRLAEKMPQIEHTFPHGAPHFSQGAEGYVATVCNGTTILRDDELTGARGGGVIRDTAKQMAAAE
jgi:N-acyl-D-aspartate/D-glutamate deacylase